MDTFASRNALPIFIVIVLAAVPAVAQAPPPDPARAEALARQGKTAEAFDLFRQIVQANPADVDSRVWEGRLAMRLGHADEAEALFRAILNEYPEHVDARIGLSRQLTRKGEWQEALEVLPPIGSATSNNADLFRATGRAYRRGGNDERAVEYFARARALAPDDPEMVLGYEAVARAYGHSIAVEGLGQTAAAGNVGSGSAAVSVRVHPRLHLEAGARAQSGPAYSDAIAGVGGLWRAAAATTVSFRATGGAHNVALPASDVGGELLHYGTRFDIGVGIRGMTFAGVKLVALSPVAAWTPSDVWRVDARYTYSRSSFDAISQSRGDHSIMLRPTWQRWTRVGLQGTYAYGIESFDDLTLDRVASISATTAAAGMRVDLRSLTRITATWEHQWRSNDSQVDRFTVSMVQTIR